MNGKNLILMINGTAAAASKSCQIRTTCDTKEVSSPSDGEWVHLRKGRKAWSVECDHLLTVHGIMGLLNVGQTVTLKFQPLYEKTYIFHGTYSGTVITDPDQVLRVVPDSMWYSTVNKCFCAKSGASYYKYWDSLIYNHPEFSDPQPGVTYIGGFSNQTYYEWIASGTARLELIPYLTGSAICTQCDAQGTVASLAKGSFSFKGNGPLTPVTTSS